MRNSSGDPLDGSYDMVFRFYDAETLGNLLLTDHHFAATVTGGLFNVHLGTALNERRAQAERLVSFVHARRTSGPKIVLGDFNEWTRGRTTSMLSERLGSIDLAPFLGRRKTYPGLFPILHLDHIYYEGHVEVINVELPRTRKALVASDHLPLVADLRVWF